MLCGGFQSSGSTTSSHEFYSIPHQLSLPLCVLGTGKVLMCTVVYSNTSFMPLLPSVSDFSRQQKPFSILYPTFLYTDVLSLCIFPCYDIFLLMCEFQTDGFTNSRFHNLIKVCVLVEGVSSANCLLLAASIVTVIRLLNDAVDTIESEGSFYIHTLL